MFYLRGKKFWEVLFIRLNSQILFHTEPHLWATSGLYIYSLFCSSVIVCSWERGCVIVSIYFISIHLQTKFKFMLLFLRYLWNPLKPSVLLVQFWPLSTPNCGCPYSRRLFFCPFDLLIGPVRQKGPVEDLSILISNLIQLGTLVRHCLMSWKDPKFYF